MLNGARTKSGRKRHPRDFYETHPDFAEAAMERLIWDEYQGLPTEYITKVVLDAGCGTGVWGKVTNKKFYSTEGIDLKPSVDEKYYDVVISGNYLKYKPNGYRYDLVFGNPPYSLAEQFVRKSFEIIPPGGYVYFLLRLSFLEGMKRCEGLYKEIPLKRVYVCSRRPSFYGETHTTDTLSYAMFLWQKGYVGKPEIAWLNWEYKK